MDTLLAQARRKKRKTRKCLDEMRKRSRYNFTNSNIPNKTCNKIEHGNCKKQRNCITTGRLTLKMFPKAVCSETITRPLLGDIKQPTYLNKKNLSDSEKLNEIMEYQTNTSNKCHEIDVSDKGIKYVNISDSEQNSSDSLILFSPLDHPQTQSNNYVKLCQVETSTSNSPIENDSYCIYERFMEKNPGYISKTYPNLNKEEFFINTIKQLQNIRNFYTGKLHQPPPKNDVYMKHGVRLMRYKVYSKETIVENPIDYIRYGCLQHYNNQESCSDSDMSHTDNCLHSPFLTSSNMESILSETPEYAYYPHKLNE